MKIVIPTPIKFDPELKRAIQDFADKKELGNLSAVVKKATIKYIGGLPQQDKKIQEHG